MTITTILIIILLSSLFCFGWEYCISYTPEGIETDGKGGIINPYGLSAKNKEVAWWFKFYLGKYLSNYPMILKPLIQCVICMSSVYGTIIYWTFLLIFVSITWKCAILYPFVLVMVAGLNRIIKMITQR